jgi:predicted nucleic acid-binding protein
MVAMRNRMGQPIGVMDALIAAIASVHGAAVATRDTHDFAELGIDVINPFRATT